MKQCTSLDVVYLYVHSNIFLSTSFNITAFGLYNKKSVYENKKQKIK